MYRSRVALGFLLAPILLILVVTAVGCGGYSEEPVVRNFFAASRMRDNVTLGNIALVAFDPRTDGQVESFKVISESPEQVETLKLKSLAKAYADARAEDEAFTKRKTDYQNENMDAIERVLKAESANKKLSGKDAEVQVAWTKWREDTQESAKKVSEARNALTQESPVVELSMNNPAQPIEVREYDGVLASKDMTVSANVRMPDGQSVKKTLVLTLQQARLEGPNGPLQGKWVITKVHETQAGEGTGS